MTLQYWVHDLILVHNRSLNLHFKTEKLRALLSDKLGDSSKFYRTLTEAKFQLAIFTEKNDGKVGQNCITSY